MIFSWFDESPIWVDAFDSEYFLVICTLMFFPNKNKGVVSGSVSVGHNFMI